VCVLPQPQDRWRDGPTQPTHLTGDRGVKSLQAVRADACARSNFSGYKLKNIFSLMAEQCRNLIREPLCPTEQGIDPSEKDQPTSLICSMFASHNRANSSMARRRAICEIQKCRNRPVTNGSMVPKAAVSRRRPVVAT